MRNFFNALQGKWALHWRIGLVVIVTTVLILGTEHSHAATLSQLVP